jgi:dymeclin
LKEFFLFIDLSYLLHLEALNLLIILLSVQMTPEKNLQEEKKKPFIYENFMFKLDERLISDFVQALLENIVKQEPLPTLHQQQNKINLISSLWSIMTLGYSSTQTTQDDSCQEMINFTDRLLALQSCHILLILSNYRTNDITFRNPFRLALFHFTDTQGKKKKP